MSNKLFTTVPVPKFPSSTFSLSRSVMFTPRIQKLYCPNIIETIPGDGINERSEQFARTQPMVAPTFAKMNAKQYAFFVPFWQINEHFDDFITGGEKGDFQDKMPYSTIEDLYNLIDSILSYGNADPQDFESQDYDETNTSAFYNHLLEVVQNMIEHIDLLRAAPFILPDFVPMTNDGDGNVFLANVQAFRALNQTLSSSGLRVNLCPFAAYLKVWSEYFRDENLCVDYFDTFWKAVFYDATGYVDIYSSIFPSVDFTDSVLTLEALEKANSLFGVLPHAWKKDYFTAALPFTQKGPDVLLPLSGTFPVDFTGAAGGSLLNEPVLANKPGAGVGAAELSADGRSLSGSVSLTASGLGATIQDVRRAFRLQEFYEADARGGNRYPENTLMQFGVRTPDSRLPRAIFLGSNSSPVQISEVVQTSSTDGTSPQGNLAGKGISYGGNRLSSYFYSMHGFLLNLYTIDVHAVYEQGVHPMFSRFDRTEYAWPRFAHLGEQPVYLKELYVDGNVGESEVFGYEPRYSEYKSEKSSVHGGLKGSLNFWTMSRRFANKPVLNEEFIYGSPRLDNFAVTNKLIAPFIVEIDYRVRANRKLPFFGVPML